MLDTETKRRIDTARDILVGKVPDPKSQVEQITIALIYKFMADMDAESEEMGGKRTFFSGEWERYGWPKLMRSGLGGHEVLALYGEAISKMPENAGIPTLFRDIFKNAYLPYRDPETLKSFLKVIDEFEYDHSERLGDAFEYLLSVLGSQGDAGQFRTPRHIIDFMVEIIDPKKDETILDPACGTAGFLISSYKHIDRNNRDEDGNSTLTPDDKGRLAKNFKGYDISPDMVRLSLVNLYLHGFSDPHIDEYDTLTSDDKWNEFVDVILANPPFMSPKGGIKPHKRFSVQSKRSEVLFVDYIAEHLTPSGRAAIIVPEGIIFQSQTAYKQLRKMLVDEYLVSVISLPAGVFQPYSGVKTSILVFDKSLAKQSDTIGFFKVENDGFSLGAQRRETDKNDLPQIQFELGEYLDALRNKEESKELQPTLGLIVEKEKIAENEEYNLSGERYRSTEIQSADWPFVKVGEVFEKSKDTVLPHTLSGPTTYLGLENITQQTGKIIGETVSEDPATIKSQKNVFAPNQILYGKLRPNLNKVWLADRNGICSTDIYVIEPRSPKVDAALYSHLFRSQRFNDAVMSQIKGAQLPRIGWGSFESLQIPLPPLEVQKEIVAEIEGYQKVIDGARAVLDNYRPHIPIHPDWPTRLVGDVVDFVSGLTVSIPKVEAEGGIPILAINNVTEDGNLSLEGLRFIDPPKKTLNYVQKGDLLFNWRNGSKHLVGKTARFDLDGNYLFASFLLGVRPHQNEIDSTYLWHTLNAYRREGRYLQFMRQNVNGLFNREELKMVEIAVPPLKTQRSIVAEIESEQSLVAANHELIERMESKIQAAIARVWGEESDSAKGAPPSQPGATPQDSKQPSP